MRETAGPNEPEQTNAAFRDPIVIVETDAAQAGYDRRLATWWEQAKRGSVLPFPRTHGIARESLLRDYRDVAVDRATDRAWHFCLRLPRSAMAGEPSSDPQRLASFRLGSPRIEITIDGHRLPLTESLPPWLDRRLEQRSLHPVSSRPHLTEAGLMADVLATWQSEADDLVGRFATVRYGDRVFVVALRTPVEHYRSVAHDYVLARSTLEPIARRAEVEHEA